MLSTFIDLILSQCPK